MGFKTQDTKYYIVKESYADKKGTHLIKNDKFQLSESQIRDLTDGIIPIEMWKVMMHWLIDENGK